jgi:hypothetical protein
LANALTDEMFWNVSSITCRTLREWILAAARDKRRIRRPTITATTISTGNEETITTGKPPRSDADHDDSTRKQHRSVEWLPRK